MQTKFKNHYSNILRHLYINPLQKCNLRCQICYTKKTAPILKFEEILDFINRYSKVISLQVITFCGGEVFALPYFTKLLNILSQKGIFIQIITNGTIDKLNNINNPNSINLIVSIDGLEEYHDKNRGQGNFKKSIRYLKKALKMSFHVEIFSIVTRENYLYINQFEKFIQKNIGNIPVTYHPKKPPAFLRHHPTSVKSQINGFNYLQKNQLIKLMKTKTTFPPYDLGCYQVSLASNGNIYNCCEGYNIIGNIDSPIKKIIDKLKVSISGPAKGCSQCQFMCGIESIIREINNE